MTQTFVKLLFFVLLSLTTGSSELLAPLFSSDEEAHAFFVVENQTDSDEVEDPFESGLVGSFETTYSLFHPAGFQPVCDEANHQIDWLFLNEHSARPPPLG